MANDKCEILLPIHCRHEGVEVGGSLLYLFYRLPIYLQTNLESQRSQVYFAAWLVLLAGYIERILYWLCDCLKPSNFVRNHSRGFNTRLMTRHGQISPFFQEKGEGVRCKSFNITEDLGQVEHVLCDKTGTLTENKMSFKSCFVLGRDFKHDTDGIGGVQPS